MNFQEEEPDHFLRDFFPLAFPLTFFRICEIYKWFLYRSTSLEYPIPEAETNAKVMRLFDFAYSLFIWCKESICFIYFLQIVFVLASRMQRYLVEKFSRIASCRNDIINVSVRVYICTSNVFQRNRFIINFLSFLGYKDLEINCIFDWIFLELASSWFAVII